MPTTGAPARSIQSLTNEMARTQITMAGGLVSLPYRNLGDRYRRLKAIGGYAFTHVGQLTRIDASAFFS